MNVLPIRLALFLFVALIGTASAQQDTDSKASWIRMDGERLFMTFRGEVVLPDGTPANDFTIRARIVESFPVKVTGNQFEFEAELKYGQHHPSLRFLVESKDGTMMAEHSVAKVSLRLAAMEGIKIKLEPAKTCRIKVLFEGQPVQDANVEVEGSFGHNIFGQTDEDGACLVKIPKSSELRKFSAWTDDELRIGGFSLSRGPTRDINAAEHVVELSRCRSQKILVLDEDENPVVGAKLETNIATSSPHINYVPRNDKDQLTTDENGEAVDKWFPDWEEFHYYVDVEEQPWVPVDRGRFQNGVFVVRVKKSPRMERKTMRGKLKISSKMEGGFLVRLGSFQHPEEGRFDPIDTRTDIDGNFTAEVMPGATYQVFLNDPKWISNYWSGILVDETTGKLNEPVLRISRGPLVEVKVTGGDNLEPLSDVQVVFDSRESFNWIEDGEESSGSLGLSKWIKTDEKGVASVRAPLGRLDVRISGNEWTPKQATTVKTGVVTRLEFHRKFPGRNLIQGRLELADQPSADQPSADLSKAGISLAAMDGECRVNGFTQSDSEGNFEYEIAGGRFGIFAILADGSAAGFSTIDSPNEKAVVELKPTRTYRAILVDKDMNPMPNVKVTMRTTIYDQNDVDNNGLIGSIRADLEKTRTDADGNYEFESVPQNVKVEFRVFLESNPRGEQLESLSLNGTKDLSKRKKVRFVPRPRR